MSLSLMHSIITRKFEQKRIVWNCMQTLLLVHKYLFDLQLILAAWNSWIWLLQF